MPQPDFSEDRLAKYVVISIAIGALVIVAWMDARSEVQIPSVVYWILGGAILGAENIINMLRK